MRTEGMKLTDKGIPFKWQGGSAESTGLADKSVGWVLMGSSFHWTNAPVALKEFRRILKPGGYFTAIWNPRDLERSELQMKVEQLIADAVPNLKRVSSGAKKYTEDLENTLVRDGLFEDLIFIEAKHELEMSVDRYLGAWRSINDIRAQAGEEKFNEILKSIESLVKNEKSVVVPYRTRAWTVRATAT